MKSKVFIFSFMFVALACVAQSQNLRLGAERTEIYMPLLKGKNVGIIGNQTSLIGSVHIVDSLLSLGVKLNIIFSPEHGFRGNAEAGATIQNGRDQKTGLPIISLYGNHKKPTAEQVKGLNIMILDLQDVGTRFYTYISTLHYVMEICAEQAIPLIVLDRPNPNGHFTDGPILEKKHASFVGMHAVPIVHGMTIGEYAQLINGEKWLKDSMQCLLTIIEMENYNRHQPYALPVPPSPNLSTDRAVALYPSLCLFEGTNVSIGRGTDKPFELFGNPFFPKTLFKFTPRVIKGKSENPPYKNQICYGIDLSSKNYDSIRDEKRLNLEYLIQMYQASSDKTAFFNDFFEKLAGTETLRRQIISGVSEKQIRQSWQTGLNQFLILRKPYLLYD